MSATVRDYVENYFATHHVAMIATVGAIGEPWICSVYYTYARGRLLFVSRSDTLHSSHIGTGCNIAFAVTDTAQMPPASAHGLQGRGFARPALIREYPLFVRYYARMFPKYAGNMTSPRALRASLSLAAETRPYVVVPNMIKLTDKRFCEAPTILELLSNDTGA